jgi:hypothetical protein
MAALELVDGLDRQTPLLCDVARRGNEYAQRQHRKRRRGGVGCNGTVERVIAGAAIGAPAERDDQPAGSWRRPSWHDSR